MEEEKKAGLISVTKRSRIKSIFYPNYAALDQLAAKGATIVAKHFGSRDAALERAKKLNDVVEVIASHLAREVIPK